MKNYVEVDHATLSEQNDCLEKIYQPGWPSPTLSDVNRNISWIPASPVRPPWQTQVVEAVAIADRRTECRTVSFDSNHIVRQVKTDAKLGHKMDTIMRLIRQVEKDAKRKENRRKIRTRRKKEREKKCDKKKHRT
uniref:Uncharacterized protein n=1 Tax=Romanomermis culicivorax TaxID=13658 RepID=A0A915JYR4_ROMCU